MTSFSPLPPSYPHTTTHHRNVRPRFTPAAVPKPTAGRGQPTPGALIAPYRTVVKPKRRRKACGRSACGWVTPTPDRDCDSCSGKVVHSAEDKLCSACHRTGGDQDFAHIHHYRIERWIQSTGEGEGLTVNRALPKPVIEDFRPSSSDCLCRREDCFYFFLAEWDRMRAYKKCVDCGSRKSGKFTTRWYRAPDGTTSGSGGVEGCWECQACNGRRRKREKESAVCPIVPPSTSPGQGVENQSRRDPADTVRRRIVDAVGRGEILNWEDAAVWLAAERSKVGYEPHQGRYRRDAVRGMFKKIARDPQSRSRVVCGDGGALCQGDGRRTFLLLVPCTMSNEIVAKYVIRGGAPEAPPGPTSQTILQEREPSASTPCEHGREGEDGHGTCSRGD